MGEAERAGGGEMTEPLHIPGANNLKVWMVKMASVTNRTTNSREVLTALIGQLYAEIRAYRLAGHGWGKLSEMIRKECKVPCSGDSVRNIFTVIDKEWSKRTGEPPLPFSRVRSEIKKAKKDAAR